MKHISFTLPIEIWELILDLLDTKSLLNFQDSCHTYRNIILDYVIRGRIRDRALVRIKTLNFKTTEFEHFVFTSHSAYAATSTFMA
jgi:hypothetical protein